MGFRTALLLVARLGTSSIGGLLLSLLFIPLCLAQQDAFADLGTTGGTCNGIAAQSAAQALIIFVVVADLLITLICVGFWWLMERKVMSTAGVRILISVLVAGLLALLLVALKPLMPAAQVALMEQVACQHYFLLGSLGPFIQGLVLGFVPAAFATLLGILVARRF
jgi:hypothetical protein